MQRMKRWSRLGIGAVGAGALVVLTALPAGAGATVTINPSATLSSGTVTVIGSVTCSFTGLNQITQGVSYTDTLNVSATEKTPHGQASGTEQELNAVPCDGAPHGWSATVTSTTGVSFVGGSGNASATYSACTVVEAPNSGALCEEGSDPNQAITISGTTTTTHGKK